MSAAVKAQKLRSLIRLLTDASEVVIQEWQAEELEDKSSVAVHALPSAELYNARRVIHGACGMCADLVQEPLGRLEEMAHGALSLIEALYILVAARIPDILNVNDARSGEGMPIGDLSCQTGIDEQKLARVLRLLCTSHVLSEVKVDHFSNTDTSQILVQNGAARSLLMLNGFGVFTKSMDALPVVLMDPMKTHTTAPTEAAFQDALKTNLTFWEWCEQGDTDGTVQPHPILQQFTTAMMATGQRVSSSVVADYPWTDLGVATVVDVGGGVGSMSMELAARFPELRIVVQDRAAVIEQGRALWTARMPNAIHSGRVKLQVHDFFQEQPVEGADVYFLRYILHDWPDDACLTILTHLRNAMGTDSRILVADMVMHTTVGSPLLKSAPAPLPANYGYASIFKNMQDLAMLALFNGTERTPEQFSVLAERAGLKVVKIWECRCVISITEMRLAAGGGFEVLFCKCGIHVEMKV